MNVCTKIKHLYILLRFISNPKIRMYFLLIYRRKKNNSIFVFDDNFYILNLLKSCIISNIFKISFISFKIFKLLTNVFFVYQNYFQF